MVLSGTAMPNSTLNVNVHLREIHEWEQITESIRMAIPAPTAPVLAAPAPAPALAAPALTAPAPAAPTPAALAPAPALATPAPPPTAPAPLRPIAILKGQTSFIDEDDNSAEDLYMDDDDSYTIEDEGLYMDNDSSYIKEDDLYIDDDNSYVFGD